VANLDLTSDLDALRYIASYPDLIAAFGANPQAGRNHYNNYGRAEGRVITFDPLLYAASNTDVARAYGTDLTQFTLHYLNFGFAEHRPTASFNALLYGASNPDVALAYGADQHALTEHYVRFGLYENRPTSGFDTVAYLLSNPDLGAAGIGLQGALTHWLNWGVREGRAGDALFGREQTTHALTPAVGAPTTLTVTDRIAGAGDRDWFSITMAAGDRDSFSVTGVNFGGGTLSVS